MLIPILLMTLSKPLLIALMYFFLASSASLTFGIAPSRTIESIVEKQGRSGKFVLVTWHTVYRNQHRELVAEASASMIARP